MPLKKNSQTLNADPRQTRVRADTTQNFKKGQITETRWHSSESRQIDQQNQSTGSATQNQVHITKLFPASPPKPNYITLNIHLPKHRSDGFNQHTSKDMNQTQTYPPQTITTGKQQISRPPSQHSHAIQIITQCQYPSPNHKPHPHPHDTTPSPNQHTQAFNPYSFSNSQPLNATIFAPRGPSARSEKPQTLIRGFSKLTPIPLQHHFRGQIHAHIRKTKRGEEKAVN